MVFSQTSHKAHSILKVVKKDRLKPNKDPQENGINGVIAGGNFTQMPSSAVPTTSYSEEFLKPEPSFESTMFHDAGYEFFQDLVPWCSDPAKEEQVQIIDSKKTPEQRAHNNDTPNTPFSPQGWEVFDTNSPLGHVGMYSSTPNEPLSPAEGLALDSLLSPQGFGDANKIKYQEEFDFANMPMEFRDLESEKVTDLNLPYAGLDGWHNTHTDYNTNIHTKNTHIMPFIDQEDTSDSKYASVIPRELESNDVVITEFILGHSPGEEETRKTAAERHQAGLTVNIPPQPAWADDINTPDIVTYVEQMEKEKCNLVPSTTSSVWPMADSGYISLDACPEMKPSPPPVQDYEDPVTPTWDSNADSDKDILIPKKRRRRHSDSDDSDYTPHLEHKPPRKYTRRNQSISINEQIKALEGSQPLKKARRGRPPKQRRESTVSSVQSVDDNCSNVSTEEMRYRELRDKNNEASKKSRMMRKLKELRNEQLAIELEDKNKKLKLKADILEDMTKRLKDALMTAILHKQ